MTLNEVAHSVGSDVGNLSRIERGAQAPSPELAEKLCRFFDGEINEIQIFYPWRFTEAAEGHGSGDAPLRTARQPINPTRDMT